MIKIIKHEYVEDDIAVRTTTITFFSIPIFKLKETSTNASIIRNLTPIRMLNKVKGFS